MEDGNPGSSGLKRSGSFDDLLQVSFSAGEKGEAQFGTVPDGSQLSFTTLELDMESKALKSSRSADDLAALEAELEEETAQEYQNDNVSEDSASVHSMPMNEDGHRGRAAGMKRSSSMDDLYDDAGYDYGDETDGTEVTEETEASLTAAEEMFGREKASELRKRIMTQSKVSEEEAQEALNAATEAMSRAEGTEGIEFFTWFTVWALIIFYLLFYSRWGPILWDFLYGPMGFLLALPFGFALLFWLMTYVFQE